MTRKLRVCSCPSEFGKAERSRSDFEARNTIGQSFPRSNFFARKNDQDLSVDVIDRSSREVNLSAQCESVCLLPSIRERLPLPIASVSSDDAR
jgi:hypothetical protein